MILRWFATILLLGSGALELPAQVESLPPPGRSEFLVPAFSDPGLGYPELRFRRGDDPRWADPAWDDSTWERRRHFNGLPARTGIYWVRFTIRQPHPPRPVRDGISLAVVAAYDLYIDGKLIARNGVVGADRETEVPGRLDNIVRIPDALLTPGPHVVALRMSAWRSGFDSDTLRLNLVVSDYRALIERRVSQATLAVVMIGGGLAVAAVLAVLWWLVERRQALLYLAAAGLVAALMQALQAWRWLGAYPYDWHRPRLSAIALSVGLLGILLVAALQEFFETRRRSLWLGILALWMTGIWLSSQGWYNRFSLQLMSLALVFALVISAWAVWRRKTGARFALLGLLVSVGAVFVEPAEVLERSFILTGGAPILGCVTAVSMRLREERHAARRAQLTAARLEIELLKKQIQPHFVMNTLTTILEVIEHDPKAAVGLIEALAEEFRVLAHVSSERRIPLAQELELCRTHLRIMSLRKDVRYALEVEGDVVDLDVPPALVLTLVENGLTHASARGQAVTFRVAIVATPDLFRLVVTAPAGAHQTPESPVRAEGTGLRYVRARLEESFPGRWSLQAGAVPEGWRTTIEVREGKRT